MGDPEKSGRIEYGEWVGTLAKVTNIARPVCPDCGSKYIVSNGPQWICNDCRRQFIKVKRPRKEPDYSGRPPCPECGFTKIISKGQAWLCDRCGRQWQKVARRDVAKCDHKEG